METKVLQTRDMYTKLTSVTVVIMFTVYCYVDGMMYPDKLMNSTTCEEFSQSARFNPYSVLHKHWFVFYYWGPVIPRTEYVFEYPSRKKKSSIHHILDEHVSVPINWTAKFVVMTNLVTNFSSLLVEVGDHGQFLEYPFLKIKKGEKITPADVRFKQTGDNKYIGFMMCEEETVQVMCQKSEIPRKKFIQDAASRIGYRGLSPKSYLYQGHNWMPIPEDDEEMYWMPHEAQQREKKALDKQLEGETEN
ncbi:hypothetical protein ACJJTC_005971 [Scirpophaga incertulas]